MVLNHNHYARFSIKAALAKFNIEIADIACKDICNDSRFIQVGDVFAAVNGTSLDGTQYIEDAINKGAGIILSQCTFENQHGKIEFINQTPVISFYQLDEKLSKVSAYYYSEPHKEMVVTGVTGTNGKTSCCQFIAQLLENLKQPTGIIGTLGAGRLNNLIDINNTTPGPTKLQQLFAHFNAENIKQVAMEVSSHALSQNRVNSEMIDIAVFTNLTRDHLDYHGDMQHYAQAKKTLFLGTNQQIHILNADDAVTQQWLNELTADNRTVLYSCQSTGSAKADLIAGDNEFLIASEVVCHNQGVTFLLQSSWGSCQVESSLLGEFNVSNLLAAMATLLVQGFKLVEIVKFTHLLRPVAGRMETFSGINKATAVVDYAHTPDGLEKALQSVQAHCHGNIWLVFGCGGDRDTGKRPLMGAIANRYADKVIVTNDNPRTENPELICKDILAGMNLQRELNTIELSADKKVQVILERSQAVNFALHNAKPEDMVLCAGKGHEDYTIIGTQKVDYNERKLVKQFYLLGVSHD